MQSTEFVPHTELTRQERFKLWMWKTSFKQSELARRLGVSKSTVGYWIRAEHLPSWRVRQMREFGIPEELLPSAKDIPSGPKPKAAECCSVAQ